MRTLSHLLLPAFFLLLFQGGEARPQASRPAPRITGKEITQALEKGLAWIASFASLALAEIYLWDGLKELKKPLQALSRRLQELQVSSGGWFHGSVPMANYSSDMVAATNLAVLALQRPGEGRVSCEAELPGGGLRLLQEAPERRRGFRLRDRPSLEGAGPLRGRKDGRDLPGARLPAPGREPVEAARGMGLPGPPSLPGPGRAVPAGPLQRPRLFRVSLLRDPNGRPGPPGPQGHLYLGVHPLRDPFHKVPARRTISSQAARASSRVTWVWPVTMRSV